MHIKTLFALLLATGSVSTFASANPTAPYERRCSLVGGIPRDGFEPRILVAEAHVILRARADSITIIPQDTILTREYFAPSLVHFTVLEVIDSGNVAIPAKLSIHGRLTDVPDFNPIPVPYRWVRPDGQRGMCNAYAYQKGGEFLLLLKGAITDTWGPYWSALTPTNEQVRGATDPWVVWVKANRKTFKN